jgi:Domain of unknown function (DUF4352)
MKKYLVLAAGALGTLVAVSTAVGTLMAIVAVDAASAATAGRTVSHHGTRYSITKVRTARSIGDGFLGGHARGVYVIVNVTLTDLKNDPATIMASNLNLTTHGRSYDVTDDMFGVYHNGLDLLERIQPGLPDPVVLVYDVPRSSLHGAKLQINDLWSGDKAYLSLGL